MATHVRRLFEQFQPANYDLSLAIDEDEMLFAGTVTVSGKKVGRPSQRVTLHQKGLSVTSATITKHDKNGDHVIDVTRINKQNSYDEVRLHTDAQLYAGNYSVTLEFNGRITKVMNGIYPCFFDYEGSKKQLIATQFESHHAREAFPCIDEPEAKATFSLTLTTPTKNSQAVLANTPITTQTEADGLTTTIFEPSPRMSTYLLAFAYGQMDYLEAKTQSGVVVRTYATPDNVQFTQFALDSAVQSLDFYNEYFDVPYPLAKCDFIALPDFASGAMENWGCITFREQAMLVDPEITSLPMKQYVANVVAHELTHQWFGNLVTMQWWNDLWLNESFASWMSYLAVDAQFPEWKVWTQFIGDEQAPALKLDSLQNTHPISVAINHPDEIRTIFDAISYEKGASVLNMLKNHIGDEHFRDGLRVYLKRHAYKNTVSTDLWQAWEEVSGMPITDFMHDWTTKSGYPIVTLDTVNKRVSQERFYLNPGSDAQSETWPVPLLANESLGVETLTKQAHVFENSVSDICMLNPSRAAFYRVAYDSQHVACLANAVKSGTLTELARLGLLSDAFETAKAGKTSTVDALTLLSAYSKESSQIVWEVIASAIGSIRLVMNDDELRANLKPYVRNLVSHELQRLGWDAIDGESHFDTLLRPTILGLAASADDEAVIREASRRFAAMQKPADIAPDIRGVIYSTIARHGGQAEFDALMKLHNSSTNSEERITLAAALTSFEHDDQINQSLQKITSNEVRVQDSMYWVAYSFMNRHARAVTWQWMKDNWEWLRENLGEDLAFYRMPLYAARVQSDASFLKEYEAFFVP